MLGLSLSKHCAGRLSAVQSSMSALELKSDLMLQCQTLQLGLLIKGMLSLQMKVLLCTGVTTASCSWGMVSRFCHTEE